MKFCLCCRNVFASESVLGLADGDGSVVCKATKVSQLDLATNAELKEAIRRIHARKGIDDARIQEIREKTLGFTYMGYNLMFDPELDAISIQPTSLCTIGCIAYSCQAFGIYASRWYCRLCGLRESGMCTSPCRNISSSVAGRVG